MHKVNRNGYLSTTPTKECWPSRGDKGRLIRKACS